jgi:hypothetical protein
MDNRETINIIRVSDSPDSCEYRMSVFPSGALETNPQFIRIDVQEIRELYSRLGWSQEEIDIAICALEKHGEFTVRNVSVPEDILNQIADPQ